MTYQLKNLNVASLDFDDIKLSLINFFNQQPDLADIDFKNDASAANLLVNILATVTAYNGVYAQFGYINSFATTTTLMQSLLGIASNNSILLAPSLSATTNRTITTIGATLQDYTTFSASTTKASSAFFFNIDSIPSNTSNSITLYSGYDVISYTNYDYVTQSCQLPYSIDPRTIGFYESATNSGIVTKWTRVDKFSPTSTGNDKTFTVINGPKGYIVTNKFVTSKEITTSSTVLIKAISSNGADANNSSVSNRSDAVFVTFQVPTGGYDELSVSEARYSLLFNATGQDRCVTINDYINAILSSGISGTNDESLITVKNNCCVPGIIDIYVSGLSEINQTILIEYLTTRCVAGIRLVYQL
jgi:hypothetical protein